MRQDFARSFCVPFCFEVGHVDAAATSDGGLRSQPVEQSYNVEIICWRAAEGLYNQG